MANNQEQYDALSKFSHQIEYTLNSYFKHNLSLAKFQNVVIGGLGGSGIGGRIIKSFLADQFPLPIEVISDYHLPHYVNEHTLLILGSYSGNTEETIEMFRLGKEKGCTMLVVSSGGKVTELAKGENIPVYPIEPGFQPRMALGYSLTFLVLIFGELLEKDFASELKEIAEMVANPQEYIESAEDIFDGLQKHVNKKVVIVTDAEFEAVGVRFAQQVQENAKAEAFVHVLPEANHNVIESYYGRLESIYLFIRSDRNERVGSRFDFLNSLLEVENNKVVHITIMEYGLRSIYETIFRLDYVSLFLADLRNVDALTVPNIMSLKEYLEHC
jgi:glucose/mannose-6-phosphate isomerase